MIGALFFTIFYLFLCPYGRAHAIGTCIGKDYLQELIIFFHCRGLREWAQVVKLDSKHYYPVSHLPAQGRSYSSNFFKNGKHLQLQLLTFLILHHLYPQHLLPPSILYISFFKLFFHLKTRAPMRLRSFFFVYSLLYPCCSEQCLVLYLACFRWVILIIHMFFIEHYMPSTPHPRNEYLLNHMNTEHISAPVSKDVNTEVDN